MEHEVIRRLARRVALAATLAVAAVALGAGTAQAVIVTNTAGHRLSLELAPGRTIAAATPKAAKGGAKPLSNKNVTYHGGPVMASNTNYAIYWDPSGGSAFPAGYASGIDRWFEDLAHDSGGFLNTDSLLVQYGASYNSHFGQALVDTDPYPGQRVRQPQRHASPTSSCRPSSGPSSRRTGCPRTWNTCTS